MTTVDILRAARALVAKEWTRRASARDSAGIACAANDEGARSWCMVGALAVVTHGALEYATEAVADVLGMERSADHRISDWNDAPGRTQADVIAAFDAAIARAS